MGGQNEQALSQAFELIEADKLEEARAILKPILDVDKDNPDAWWLYAHAVTDPEAAQLALTNVRRLDPDYLNASELLYSLEKQSPTLDFTDTLSEEPSFLPAFPSTLPGMSDRNAVANDDDWDLPDDEENEEVPFFRRPIFLLGIGTIIFAIIASLFVVQSLSPQNSEIIETPTNQEVVMETATVEMSEVIEATVTGEPLATLQTVISNDEFDTLYTVLSDFSVAENGISVEQTSLGNTIVVSVCTEPGISLRETLPNVLKALARESSILSADIQAISTRMLDCSNDATLLMIGVPLVDAQAYASGSLDDALFQSKWLPVN